MVFFSVSSILFIQKFAQIVGSLHDFEIRVGNKQISGLGKGVQFKDNPLCFGYVGHRFLEDSKPRTVKCEVCFVRFTKHLIIGVLFGPKPCPLSGRFVTIQIVNDCTDCPNAGENYLNLAEVQVFGFLSE